MKKVICFLLVAFILMASVAYAEEPIKVSLNNTILTFNVAPVIRENSVMVPARRILESLNMKVTYDHTTRTVFAYGNNTAMIIKIDSKKATVLDKTVDMPVAAAVINGSTLVPARFVAESLGAQVKWDAATRTVCINTQVNANGDAVDKLDLSGITFKQ